MRLLQKSVLGFVSLSAILWGVGCGSDESNVGTGNYTQLSDTDAGGGSLDGSETSDTLVNADGTLSDAVGTDSVDGGIGTDGISSEIIGTDAIISGQDSDNAKYQTCSSLLQCVAAACQGTGWAATCDTTCVQNAGSTASSSYAPIGTCIESTCRKGICAGSGDVNCMNQCVQQHCWLKIGMCGADGKSGSAGCSSYFECTTACAKTSATCASDCYAALSPSAQGQIQTVDACASAAGGTDPFSACPEQALKCFANGKTGSVNCEDTWACTAACNTGSDTQKGQCMAGCYGLASASAQTAFAKVIGCESGGKKTGCPDAFLGCLNPTGNSGCIAALTCFGTCKQEDPVAKAKCSFACLDSASVAEAKKALVYGSCTDGCNCKGDQKCEATCNTTTCKAEFDACQGK